MNREGGIRGSGASATLPIEGNLHESLAHTMLRAFDAPVFHEQKYVFIEWCSACICLSHARSVMLETKLIRPGFLTIDEDHILDTARAAYLINQELKRLDSINQPIQHAYESYQQERQQLLDRLEGALTQ